MTLCKPHPVHPWSMLCPLTACNTYSWKVCFSSANALLIPALKTPDFNHFKDLCLNLRQNVALLEDFYILTVLYWGQLSVNTKSHWHFVWLYYSGGEWHALKKMRKCILYFCYEKSVEMMVKLFTLKTIYSQILPFYNLCSLCSSCMWLSNTWVLKTHVLKNALQLVHMKLLNVILTLSTIVGARDVFALRWLVRKSSNMFTFLIAYLTSTHEMLIASTSCDRHTRFRRAAQCPPG